MFEEDHPENLSRSEIIQLVHLCGLCVLGTWLFGGAAEWTYGFLCAAAVLGPPLLAISRAHHFDPQRARVRFALLLAPAWLGFLTLVSGLFNRELVPVQIARKTFLELHAGSPWMPSNLCPADGWLLWLLYAPLFASAATAYFGARGRFQIKLVLIVLGINAVALAGWGLIQPKLLPGKILGLVLPPNPHFFGTFAHYQHWAAFAILWMGALLALALDLLRHQGWRQFFLGAFPALLGAAALCGTAVAMGVPQMQAAALLLLGAGLFLAGLEARRTRGLARWPALLTFTALGAACAAAAAWIIERALSVSPWNLLARSGADGTLFSADLFPPLWRDSFAAFLAKPVFGWGAESFTTVFAFLRQNDLPNALFESPRSDLLKALVENGLAGTLVWLLPPALLVYWSLRHKEKAFRAPLFLLGTCGVVALLGVGGFPFANPLVFYSFWLLLFTAFRWNRLEMPKAPTPVSRFRRQPPPEVLPTGGQGPRS